MKSYTLWEANREIFLFPENWLEPEFRDDKTPFFTEPAQELQQGDITAEWGSALVVQLPRVRTPALA